MFCLLQASVIVRDPRGLLNLHPKVNEGTVGDYYCLQGQHLNSELPYMKNTQEVYQSDFHCLCIRVKDRIVIYSQISIYSKMSV